MPAAGAWFGLVALLLLGCSLPVDHETQRPTSSDAENAAPRVEADRDLGSDEGRPREEDLAPTADRAGFSPGSMILSLDDDALANDLDVMASTGARYLRLDLDWSRIEPRRGEMRWDNTDRIVSAARARGFEIVALVTYTPPWARPPGTIDKYRPDDPSAFAAFAGAAAERYARQGVTIWEIWNEPNVHQFWQPKPDPASYATMLKQTSAAIRSVTDHATILTGGLAPAENEADGRAISPTTFLAELYEHGVQDSFDGVGIHPYSYPALPTEDLAWNTFANLPVLREIMLRYGDADKRIWGTEFGAPTGSSVRAVSEQRQAEIARVGYAAWTAWPWTGPLLWYAHRDLNENSQDPEANFGLRRSDGTKKPAAVDFARLLLRDGADRLSADGTSYTSDLAPPLR